MMKSFLILFFLFLSVNCYNVSRNHFDVVSVHKPSSETLETFFNETYKNREIFHIYQINIFYQNVYNFIPDLNINKPKALSILVSIFIVTFLDKKFWRFIYYLSILLAAAYIIFS